MIFSQTFCFLKCSDKSAKGSLLLGFSNQHPSPHLLFYKSSLFLKMNSDFFNTFPVLTASPCLRMCHLMESLQMYLNKTKKKGINVLLIGMKWITYVGNACVWVYTHGINVASVYMCDSVLSQSRGGSLLGKSWLASYREKDKNLSDWRVQTRVGAKCCKLLQ